MKHLFFAIIAVTGVLLAQTNLEDLGVRGIQALLNGSAEDEQRLSKMVDDDLAVHPAHALAKLLHGVLVFRHSGEAANKGDLATMVKLYQSSVAEMDEAVQLEPNNIGVRVPRGAIFITASRTMPPQMGKPLLESGVADFEHVLQMQQNGGTFEKLSNHQRGELLTGLADGWARIGDENKSRGYFERIVKEMPGTVYQTRAQAWLDGKPESKSTGFFACAGCHVSK